MATSFGAICTDFYVNQKLSLKLDLPSNRETVLQMFDRIKRELPQMDRFRRYEDELALESASEESRYSWLALRRTSLRTGWVNPTALDQAYKLHQLILEIAPYFLSISSLDVEFLELVFGFDLAAETNRNEVVFDALLAGSPLGELIDHDREQLLDTQPFLGIALNTACDLQAFVEVKTRTTPREVAERRYSEEPISVYLTVRRYGPLKTLDDLLTSFGMLAGHVERLAEDRVIPYVVMPIREQMLSRPG